MVLEAVNYFFDWILLNIVIPVFGIFFIIAFFVLQYFIFRFYWMAGKFIVGRVIAIYNVVSTNKRVQSFFNQIKEVFN